VRTARSTWAILGPATRTRPVPLGHDHHPCAPDAGETDSRRPGAQVGSHLAGARHLPVRPVEVARADLLDRHAATNGERVIARGLGVLLHAHRHPGALPADARPRGVLPDGVGRQWAGDRAAGAELLRGALRSVAAVRPGLPPTTG